MKRTVTVILLATTLLGLFSACGTAEPVPSESTADGPTVIIIESTADMTAQDTTSAPERLFSLEEVERLVKRIVDKKVSEVEVVAPVNPGEGFPDDIPMPECFSNHYVEAEAYCVFGENDSELFVSYVSSAWGPEFNHEICYRGPKHREGCWDRINLVLAEEIVGIYAIDRQHFIVLLDFYKNGYGIGIYENGIDLSACGMYAPMYRCDYPETDLSYLFPAEDFVGAGEGQLDDGYVFFQSVTGFYCEDIDGESCRIVLEYEKDGVSHKRTAIYDINGIRPE